MQFVDAVFISFGDAKNPSTWSGTTNRILKVAQQCFRNVIVLDIDDFSPAFGSRLRAAFDYRLFGLRGQPLRSSLSGKRLEGILRRRLSHINKIDIIITTSTIIAAALSSKYRVIVWTDALFGQMVNYYASFAGLSRHCIRYGNATEKRALTKVSLALFSSTWAAEYAKTYYSTTPEKVKVIPFGANSDSGINGSTSDRGSELDKLIEERTTKKQKHLLFIGYDWERKGGMIALSCFFALRSRGVDCTLDIVGPVENPVPENLEGVFFHGPINKATSAGREKIDRLLKKAFAFLLPSTAEAYGLVLCEAASYGIPCFAAATGGIPTIIDDFCTGRLLTPGSSGEDYADAIENLLRNEDAYRAMSQNAFNKALRLLNWQRAQRSFKEYLAEL